MRGDPISVSERTSLKTLPIPLGFRRINLCRRLAELLIPSHVSASLPIPLFPSLLSLTRVSYYGLFLIFPDLFLVFPLVSVIPRSLLDSLRWHGPASTLRAPLNSSSLPPPYHCVRIAPTSPPLCRFHLHIAPASTSCHFFFFFLWVREAALPPKP